MAPILDWPTDLGQGTGLPIPAVADYERQLQDFLAQLPQFFPASTTVQAVERQGPLVQQLLQVATQQRADLLCLGDRVAAGHEGLSATGLRLLRKAPCSVLLVPPAAAARYERILVPVDFSDHSLEALETACALARSQPGASLTVKHTYEVPLGWHKSNHSYEEFADIMHRHARQHWEKYLPKFDCHGVRWQVRFDLGDKVPATILHIAEEMDASLIVLGSHGRTQPAGFLLGHVADTLCAQTTRPALCVKRKGEVVNLLHALLQLFQFEHEWLIAPSATPGTREGPWTMQQRCGTIWTPARRWSGSASRSRRA